MSNYRSEKSLAKEDGAQQVKNSGRGKEKGDATMGPFRIDYKQSAKSFGLTRDVWLKIATDAHQSGGEPALGVLLGLDDPIRLWVISDMMMKELLETYWMYNDLCE